MATTRHMQPRPSAPGRPVILPVPWERALTIRERLLEWGIKSIARFDPQGRQAKLEILHDVDPRSIKALLKRLPN